MIAPFVGPRSAPPEGSASEPFVTEPLGHSLESPKRHKRAPMFAVGFEPKIGFTAAKGKCAIGLGVFSGRKPPLTKGVCRNLRSSDIFLKAKRGSRFQNTNTNSFALSSARQNETKPCC